MDLVIEINPNDLISFKDEEKQLIILQLLNEKLETEMTINSVDEAFFSTSSKSQLKKSQMTEKDFLNSTDIILLKSFTEDVRSGGFNSALEKFESNAASLDLEKQEFLKYESFANVLSLIHLNDPSIFSDEKSSYLKMVEDGCEESIAAYSLATLSLSACWLTGPSAPIFCTAAVAAKALAFKMMIDACKEEETIAPE